MLIFTVRLIKVASEYPIAKREYNPLILKVK